MSCYPNAPITLPSIAAQRADLAPSKGIVEGIPRMAEIEYPTIPSGLSTSSSVNLRQRDQFQRQSTSPVPASTTYSVRSSSVC